MNTPQGSHSLTLLGETASGKDSFILALWALNGYDGIAVDIDAIELNEAGIEIDRRFGVGDAWPDATRVQEIKEFRIRRYDRSTRSFVLTANVVNNVGVLFDAIGDRDINLNLLTSKPGYIDQHSGNEEDKKLLQGIQGMIHSLESSVIEIFMLDIAHLLTNFPANHPTVRARDRELQNRLKGIVSYISQRVDDRRPIIFCVTKIDGKFLEGSVNALLIAKYIDQMQAILRKGLSDDQTRSMLSELVLAINKDWPAELREEGVPQERPDPHDWLLPEFSNWLTARNNQLKEGRLDDPQTMTLAHKTEDQLIELIHERLPKLFALIQNTRNFRVFAISATGHDIVPNAGSNPINVDQVLSFILGLLETERQAQRDVPIWLRWFSSFVRRTDIALKSANR